MDTTTARDLYEALSPKTATRLLDVRNEDEFSRWRVEGPGRIDTLNLPYFDFIEAEKESVDRVRRWLDGANAPLVVVCAKGGSSEFVAEILRGEGIEARNLEGGMIAWGRETVARPVLSGPLRVWQIQRFGNHPSGHESIVTDGFFSGENNVIAFALCKFSYLGTDIIGVKRICIYTNSVISSNCKRFPNDGVAVSLANMNNRDSSSQLFL